MGGLRIALATSPGSDLISNDDEILAAAIRARGDVPEIRDWSDEAVDWASYDLVAIRTTWDYHLRLDAFLKWAREVSAKARLVNDYSLLEWNAHKSYMVELAKAGVPAVPTFVIEKLDEVRTALSELGASRVVVKPEVGASAMETLVHSRDDLATIDAHVWRLLRDGKALIQPFMSRVQTDGELSIVWIGDRVTHAVQKTPGLGDFRVQVEHGGSNLRVDPPQDALDLAQACIANLTVSPTFARVDAVRDDAGVLRLMELELIEPELMFEWAPEAADVMAETLSRIPTPAGPVST